VILGITAIFPYTVFSEISLQYKRQVFYEVGTELLSINCMKFGLQRIISMTGGSGKKEGTMFFSRRGGKAQKWV
jgi:hypothetical protein